ncbi:MarR family transcriptional regulator [Catenulispora sp. NF23]|uniref:MarR family transcriptional regulator n=1 Tax=Catenulispora pinistramenti TaxID=2705254 RepID=A0ABS5KM09_9ACTN|nr:MarR family transcriptional regulator [Catenulispora pinistramenti]MBS2534282.1 MarR family transcriptional regulator [Catenulispora pinistramenti]MBS2547093.1 MarR family transcriptional regulator [Catenulispora pinistramenti]
MSDAEAETAAEAEAQAPAFQPGPAEADIFREFLVALMVHNEAVAARLGLQSADIAAAILLESRGPMPVGAIAEELGLPSASATRVIDRLQKAGYVRRVRSDQDRRAVYVELLPDGMTDYHAAAEISQRHLAEVAAHYSLDQVMVMLDMYRRTTEAYRSATAEVRNGGTAGP